MGFEDPYTFKSRLSDRHVDYLPPIPASIKADMHPFLIATVFEYTLVEIVIITPPADEPTERLEIITHYVGGLSLKML